MVSRISRDRLCGHRFKDMLIVAGATGNSGDDGSWWHQHHHHHHRNPSQTVGRVHSVAVSAMQDDEVEGHFEPFYEVRLKYAVSLCECVVKKA